MTSRRSEPTDEHERKRSRCRLSAPAKILPVEKGPIGQSEEDTWKHVQADMADCGGRVGDGHYYHRRWRKKARHLIRGDHAAALDEGLGEQQAGAHRAAEI